MQPLIVIYLDDLNISVYSVKEGIELCKKLKIRFQEVQFNLRKWRTNSNELCEFIEPFDVNSEIVKNDAVNIGILNSQTVNSEFVNKIKNRKVLGIEWDDDGDKLIFRLNEIFKDALNIHPTKRNILSVISTIYDPVGYLQLVTIQLKILFQEICKLKVDWDDIIKDILPKWNNICKYLNSLQEIVINRCYYVYQFDDPIDSYYLHGFSDSSLAAYAACIYLKSVSRSGNICVICFSNVTSSAVEKIIYYTKIGVVG